MLLCGWSGVAMQGGFLGNLQWNCFSFLRQQPSPSNYLLRSSKFDHVNMIFRDSKAA